MRPYLIAAAAFVTLSSRPLDSFAQDASCPDDAWICPQDNVVIVKPDQAPGQVIIIVPPSAQVTTAPPVIAPPPPPASPPPPSVSRPAPTPKCELERPSIPVRTVPAKRMTRTNVTSTARPAPQRGAIGLHVSRFGFLVDEEDGATNPDASMWGGGIDMRFFLRKNLEFDVSTDLVIGQDYHGFDRFQQDLSLYFVRHFNHASRLRFYALGGGNIGMGAVTSEKPSPLLPEQNKTDDLYYANYGMAGGQIGLGTELRLGESTSARLMVIGMHQWRFASTNDAPESIAPMSGGPIQTLSGIMVRTGLSFGELW